MRHQSLTISNNSCTIFLSVWQSFHNQTSPITFIYLSTSHHQFIVRHTDRILNASRSSKVSSTRLEVSQLTIFRAVINKPPPLFLFLFLWNAPPPPKYLPSTSTSFPLFFAIASPDSKQWPIVSRCFRRGADCLANKRAEFAAHCWPSSVAHACFFGLSLSLSLDSPCLMSLQHSPFPRPLSNGDCEQYAK